MVKYRGQKIMTIYSFNWQRISDLLILVGAKTVVGSTFAGFVLSMAAFGYGAVSGASPSWFMPAIVMAMAIAGAGFLPLFAGLVVDPAQFDHDTPR